MRKKKSVFMFLLMISLIFSLCIGSVYAQTKNEIAQNTESSKNQEQENNNLTNNDVQKDYLNVNPKTGDNVIAYYALYLIALLGIITLLMVSSAKSNRKILGGKENEI